MRKKPCGLLVLLIPLLNFAQNIPDSLKLKWEHYRLANGLQVVLQPDTTQALVSVEFWIGTGAKDEPTGMHGFAHYFEHATPFGLQKDTIAQKALNSLRRNSNAQTRRDYTRYFVLVQPEGLELALRAAAGRLNADTGRITDRLADWHRNNVLNEMTRQEPNPFYGPLAAAAREEATFGMDHPYGHSAYGTRAENERFTASQLRQWYSRYFYPRNTLLFVVGRFDREKARDLIRREFEGLSGTGTANRFKAAPITDPRPHTLATPIPHPFLSISWPVPPYASADAASLQLLAFVLDARLKQSAQDSVLSAGSSELLSFFQEGGEFGLFASFMSPSDSTRIETWLRTTLQELIKKGVEEREVRKAYKDCVEQIASFEKELGFAESRTELLGEGLLFAKDPGFYLKRLKKQGKLTGTDLQKVAEKWLTGSGARVLVVPEHVL